MTLKATALLFLAATTVLGACDGVCTDNWGRSCDLPAAELVAVPAGDFAMGCNAKLDTNCTAREAPNHSVTVGNFSIEKNEVTTTAFSAFLNATSAQSDALRGCGAKGALCTPAVAPDLPIEKTGTAWAPKTGMGQRPMTVVTWHGASAYCAWSDLALCTEAQWEKAARGVDGRTYPWGEAAPTCAHSVWHTQAGPGCGTDAPHDIGGRAQGASPYGALDMAGNVWEWVADAHHATYQDAPTDGSAWVAPSSTFRVIRGGGGGGDAKDIRASVRGDGSPGDGNKWRGFRCCTAI